MGYACYLFTTPQPVDPDGPPLETIWIGGPTQEAVEQFLAGEMAKPGPYDVAVLTTMQVFDTVVVWEGARVRLFKRYNNAMIQQPNVCTFLSDQEFQVPPVD